MQLQSSLVNISLIMFTSKVPTSAGSSAWCLCVVGGGGWGEGAHPALSTAFAGVRGVGGEGGERNGVPDVGGRGEDGVPEDVDMSVHEGLSVFLVVLLVTWCWVSGCRPQKWGSRLHPGCPKSWQLACI